MRMLRIFYLSLLSSHEPITLPGSSESLLVVSIPSSTVENVEHVDNCDSYWNQILILIESTSLRSVFARQHVVRPYGIPSPTKQTRLVHACPGQLCRQCWQDDGQSQHHLHGLALPAVMNYRNLKVQDAKCDGKLCRGPKRNKTSK